MTKRISQSLSVVSPLVVLALALVWMGSSAAAGPVAGIGYVAETGSDAGNDCTEAPTLSWRIPC